MQQKSNAAPVKRGKRGEGSVYLEKRTGTYIATQPVGRGLPPLTYRGKTEAAAIAARDAARLAHHNGEIDLHAVGTSAQKTVGDLLRTWLHEEVRPQYAKSGQQAYGLENVTYVTYEHIVRLHMLPYALATVRLDHLDITHIQIWLRQLLERGVGVPTQEAALRRLKTCLRWAMINKKGLKHNPATLVKAPRHVSRRYPAPDEAELARLIEAALQHPRWGRAVPLTLICGLRKQEVLGLQFGDVDIDGRRLYIRRKATTVHGKVSIRSGVKMHADETQFVALSDEALELLRAQRAYLSSIQLSLASSTAWVFPSMEAGPMGYTSFDRFYHLACQTAGVEHTFHQLRHDTAGLMLKAGRPLIEVSRHLRHRRIETTANLYAHLMQDQHQDAAMAIGASVGRLMAPAGRTASA